MSTFEHYGLNSEGCNKHTWVGVLPNFGFCSTLQRSFLRRSVLSLERRDNRVQKRQSWNGWGFGQRFLCIVYASLAFEALNKRPYPSLFGYNWFIFSRKARTCLWPGNPGISRFFSSVQVNLCQNLLFLH